jgi:replicative DNA helicase
MDGKTKTELPQNLDAEASLLGAVLIDGDVIIKIADIISPDDFFDPRHQRIYEAITGLYEDHSSIDVLNSVRSTEIQ